MGRYIKYAEVMDETSGVAHALTATGTTYSNTFNVSNFDDLNVFCSFVYTNQSGATVDVTLQTKNPVTGNWHDHTSFTQATDDTTERKNLTSGFGGLCRFKVVAGGTFGSDPDESVALRTCYYGKGN